MKRIWLVVALLSVLLLGASPVLAQDGFYVIAGGGGVGTKITSLPYTISNPGFYYLTGNLSYSGSGHGITVASDDVTLDLMGFRISGPGSGGNDYGISLFDGATSHNNVEVRNGTLSGWRTCIRSAQGQRIRVLNLRVENCMYGIHFEASLGNNMVKGCSVEASTEGIIIWGGVATGNVIANCPIGIHGKGVISGNATANCQVGINGNGIISGNSVYNSSSTGIACDGGSIIGNTIVATDGSPTGISISSSIPVLVMQNTVGGPGVHYLELGDPTVVNINNAGF